MVFTSLPPYLDSPHWHQEPNHQLGSTTTASMNENHLDHHQQPSPDPLPPQQSSTGSIRPNSMTDRARIAKIPQPESASKCPRCESTNTKFCYFNNYSLSQPRHFCKTCRRYWTRGGALRNVPVGGGCRRNKRSKGSGSKSSASGAQKGGSSSNTTSTSTNNTTTSLPSNSFTSDAITNMVSPLLPQLPYMTSLHQLHEYGDHMGFSFNTIQPPLVQGNDMDFQMGNCSTPTSAVGGGGGNILSEQWRSQQFPFLSGGSYPFEGDMAAVKMSAPVKMEETQGFNLSREFMSTQGNDQYWGGGVGVGVGVGVGNSNAWTDLSGFTSSTATHLL